MTGPTARNWLELLLDDVLCEILDLLHDGEIHVLALALPAFTERLDRIERTVRGYRVTHPYSCPHCHLRFPYASFLQFHKTRDHGQGP